MRLPLTTAAIGLASLIAVSTAFAQTPPSASQIKPFPITPGGGSAKSVNISVSYQFFLEGSASDMVEQAKLADDGRKHLYRMLARECQVLLETIADECYINRANVSTRVQNYRQRRDGIQVSGSATYRIELKPTKSVDGTAK